MAVQIVLTDYICPAPLGASGSLFDYLADFVFLFGGSQAQSILNRAPNKTVQGELVGAPAIAGNYARFGPVDYFRTAGGIGGAVTFAAVVRKVDVSRLNFGSYDAPTQKGVLAYMQSANQFWAGTNGTQGAQTAFAPDDRWYFIAVTFDGAATRLYVFGGGAPLFTATETKATVLAPAPFKIGGFGALGEADAAAALVYPVVLDQAELTQVYNRLSTMLAARGVALA